MSVPSVHPSLMAKSTDMSNTYAVTDLPGASSQHRLNGARAPVREKMSAPRHLLCRRAVARCRILRRFYLITGSARLERWTNATRTGKICSCSGYLSCRGRKGDRARCESLTERRAAPACVSKRKFTGRV